MRMLAHARYRGIDVDWTFFCLLDKPGAMEDRVRSLGAGIVRSPVPLGNPAEFVRALRKEILRGQYDIIHGHHDIINSIYLLASLRTQVSTRICHVHNADESIPTGSALKKFLTREPMRETCIALADKVVGISRHTLDKFLGGRRHRPGRDLVHYYGVDPTPFERQAKARDEFRREFSIPPDAPVILFAGRLVPEKNPVFAIDVIAAMRAAEPHVVAVFAGAGSEERNVRKRSAEVGVDDILRLAGWRNDLPNLMMGADCFILPRPDRPQEGFGLAVVEAQLAGLRLLLSEGIPDDPLLPGAVFTRLPVTAGAAAWGNAATRLMRLERPSQDGALTALARSPMNLDHALDDLLRIHER